VAGSGKGDYSWRKLELPTKMDRHYSGYGYDKPILKRSSSLINSIKVTLDTSTNNIRITSDSPYAKTHQFGMKNPIEGAKDIPARPFLNAPKSCRNGGATYIKHFRDPLFKLFEKFNLI